MRGLLVVITNWSINIQIFSQGIDIATDVKMLALGDSYTIGESQQYKAWVQRILTLLE